MTNRYQVEEIAEVVLRHLLELYPTVDIHAAHARAIAEAVCENRNLKPRPEPLVLEGDDEEFCRRCLAGVDSSEHAEKCYYNDFAEMGESAAPCVPSIGEQCGDCHRCNVELACGNCDCQMGCEGRPL